MIVGCLRASSESKIIQGSQGFVPTSEVLPRECGVSPAYGYVDFVIN